MKKAILSVIAAFVALTAAQAQFYIAGDDPGSLKWNYIRTPNYKVIYPVGTDSLARAYARALETNRTRVALSAGYLPGETYWRTTPVVLHTHTAHANGSVGWAPMRMDLYTLPEAYNPETLPWVQELCIHENRHVAQMQFAADGILRPFTYIFGEAATGLFSGMFPNYWMLEGDAVAAETGLSKFGRGRSADFMAYYATAFDKEDFRNWEKWRWGSWRRYAPNHYALGYMTVAGARYLYGDPLFTKDYLKLSSHKPFKMKKVRAWFEEHSGKKMDAAFKDIMDSFKETWNKEAQLRGPFMPLSLTQDAPKWYTSYKNLATGADGSIYAVKNSFVKASELIRIDSDKTETKVKNFSSQTSPLAFDGGRLWFTETIEDKRWTLAGESNLRVLDDGGFRTLTHGHRYYNPALGPDGLISVTEYPFNGGSAIVLLDRNGKQINRIPAPDGVQIVESAWLGDQLFISNINEDGFGILCLGSDGAMEPVLANGPEKINHLKNWKGALYFISDRNGVEEVYRLSKDRKSLERLTNTKYGVTDYAFSDDDALWFAARRYEGNLLCRTENPQNIVSPLVQYHSYAVADTLSAQEKRLAAEAGIDLDAQWNGEISEPKKYNKLLNAIRIHSWVPLSISYDNVSSISVDETYERLYLGATVLFQNTLGTLSGLTSFGHKFVTGGKDRNIFHLNLTYTGLYPVIEATVDIGERDAVQYQRRRYEATDVAVERLQASYIDQPYIEADVKAYVPLNFSSGGWLKGLIPQIRYVATNDRYNKGAAIFELQKDHGDFINPDSFIGYRKDKNVLMHSLYASLRGYIMRPTAHSQVYPSLGIGAEVGWHGRVSLTSLYSPSVYAYMYGYLPGFAPQQGLRLTALGQYQFSALRFENTVKTQPRGFEDGVSMYSDKQLRLTADYAIPFSLGDISAFSPLFYIKNFILTPHVDYTILGSGKVRKSSENLYSIGADFTVKVANLLWFPFDSEVGISYNYNGGSMFDTLSKTSNCQRNQVWFVFKTSL